MRAERKRSHVPVGLRTLKTAVAVGAAMLLVERYGISADELLFGVMGAFSAMEHTFKASVRSCVAQISGVVIGVLLAVAIRMLGLSGVAAAGVGIIVTMGIYQLLHLRTSPVLPCLILITICTDPQMQALDYGVASIWNTALGLGVGMLINMLVFPYDNSRQIRQSMRSLDEDLIHYLEDRFDGDAHLPETDIMRRKISALEGQLSQFSDQRLLLRRKQKQTLADLKKCAETAQKLLVEVEVLQGIGHMGHLDQENRAALRALGANISTADSAEAETVEDVVVNYHVARILRLRRELRERLSDQR